MQTALLSFPFPPREDGWGTGGRGNFTSLSSLLDVLLVRRHLKDGSSGLWTTSGVLVGLGKLKKGPVQGLEEKNLGDWFPMASPQFRL